MRVLSWSLRLYAKGDVKMFGLEKTKEKYERDVEFRALVDSMYAFIVHSDGRFTPSELREAAIYAATKYEVVHVRPVFVKDGQTILPPARERW